MKIRHNSLAKWTALFLCIIALSLVLVACGNSGSTTTTLPTPTPTPTPTPPPGTLYTGDGYTIRYPDGWKVGKQGTLVTLTPTNGDPTLAIVLTVTPANPGANLDTLLAGGITGLKGQLQNYQPDNTIPATTTVGGETWKQGGGSGDTGGYHLKGVVLVTQHPTGTGKVFIISLVAKADTYDQVYNSTYKPILDSYTFS